MNSVNLFDCLTRVINISGIKDGEALLNPPALLVESEKGQVGFTLQLECVVLFPTSLVISEKTVCKYLRTTILSTLLLLKRQRSFHSDISSNV